MTPRADLGISESLSNGLKRLLRILTMRLLKSTSSRKGLTTSSTMAPVT